MTNSQNTLTPTRFAEQVNAALAKLGAGDARAAEAELRPLTESGEADAAVYYLRGQLLMQLGDSDPAIQMFYEATTRAADHLPYWYAYGGALLQNDDAKKTAYDVFTHIHACDPDFADARYFLGIAALKIERWPTAIAQLRETVARQPSNSRAAQALIAAEGLAGRKADMSRLAQTASSEGDIEGAVYWLEQTVLRNPNNHGAYWQLATHYTSLERYLEAIQSYRRVTEINENNRLAALQNIAWIYSQRLMDAEAVVTVCREILALPNHGDAHRVALHEIMFYLPFMRRVEPQELLDAALDWQAGFGTGVIAPRASHANTPDPERKLRVGFVSRLYDRWFYSRQIMPMLTHNDPDAFEIYCYQMCDTPEPVIGGEPAVWRRVAGWTRHDVAEAVVRDQIDILIDCNGHSLACGNEIFCEKPAPLQVAWSNKAMTTGSRTMDYFIMDELMLPGFDEYFVEKLYRMPCYYVPYPMLDTPPVADLPLDRNGFITFGTLSTPHKFSEDVWPLWAAVLRAVPEARFHMKNGYTSLSGFREIVWGRFEKLGIPRSRILFTPGAGHYEFLQGYDEIDVSLDTVPIPGGNTQIEGLWQGVPSITLAGSWWVPRAGLAVLTRVGLPDFVAHSPEEYVRIAVEVSRDADRLRRIRGELRDRMERSGLVDAAAFARRFQDAMRFMWREWCRLKQTGEPMRSGPIGASAPDAPRAVTAATS